MSERGIAKELAERRAKLIRALSGTDDNAGKLRYNLYNRYSDLATLLYTDPMKEGLIRGNKEAFEVLGDTTIYMWAFTGRSTDEFKGLARKNQELTQMFSNMQELQKGIDLLHSITDVKFNVSLEEFVRGLVSFNKDNIVPLMDDIEIEEEDIGFVSFDDCIQGSEGEEPGIDDEYFVDEEGEEVLEEKEGAAEEQVWGEDDEEMDPEIEANCNRIMAVYKDLFEVGFELRAPHGVLVKEGILRVNNKGVTALKRSASMSRIYDMLNDLSNDFMVQSQLTPSTSSSDLRNVKMRRGTTYYPEFQLGNLFGILGDIRVGSWEELEGIIKNEIRTNITSNIKEGRDIQDIVDSLTTAVVISEFNPRVALKLRINIGNGLVSGKEFSAEYMRRKSSILAGTGELYYIKQLRTGVIELAIVFSRSAYNARPIFAYEAVGELLSRGRVPSINELILGQDSSGKIMTANLDRQNSCITLIGAGPRSGKGVLTLNIAGAILAGGHPLVYLDGKPDMAEILWRVSDKHSIDAAVWDIYQHRGKPLGLGAPDEVRLENSDIFGVLIYLKVMQLMMAAAHLRSTKGIQVGGEGKRPFFVFDEALAVQATMAGAWKPIIALAKDKKNDSPEAEWCRGIVNWTEQLAHSLVGTMNSQLPKSGISTIWLFQTIQPTSWNAFNTQGTSGDFNILKSPIMARTSIKMLGRGTTDSEYGLGNSSVKNDKEVAEKVMSADGRHFAYTEAQKVTGMELIKIFKPYLVLNEHENGTPSVEELRKNVSAEVWDAITVNGQLEEGAGFEGFVNMIGEDAVRNLGKGKEFLMEVMKHLGLTGTYGSVDEYLYDASAESFKSLGTLLNPEEDILGGGIPGDTGEWVVNNAAPRGILEGAMGKGVGMELLSNGIPVGADDNEEYMREVQARKALDREIAWGGLEEADQVFDGTEGIVGEAPDEVVVDSGESRDIPAEGPDILVERRENPTVTMVGKDGRRNIIDTQSVKTYSRLNNDNSIDCTRAGAGSLSWIEEMMLDTPKGAERYIRKLWDSILNSIVAKGYKKANITRVSLYGGQMYVNGKIVNLNGVLGGYECIRLKDIAQFRRLFKKFFMTRELRMDEEMLRTAAIELGDNTLDKLFGIAPRLEKIYVQSDNGSTTLFERGGMNSDRANDMYSRGKQMNDMDLYCASNNSKGWKRNYSGDNIWGLRLAKNSLEKAGEHFMSKNKPSMGKAIVYSTTGLLVGTVGAAAWGIAGMGKGLFNLAGMFRR